LGVVVQVVQMGGQAAEGQGHMHGVYILLNHSQTLWLQLLVQEAIRGVPQEMAQQAQAASYITVVK